MVERVWGCTRQAVHDLDIAGDRAFFDAGVGTAPVLITTVAKLDSVGGLSSSLRVTSKKII